MRIEVWSWDALDTVGVADPGGCEVGITCDHRQLGPIDVGGEGENFVPFVVLATSVGDPVAVCDDCDGFLRDVYDAPSGKV